MKRAPIPEMIVIISPRKIADTETATTISDNNNIVDVDAEMLLSPSSQR